MTSATTTSSHARLLVETESEHVVSLAGLDLVADVGGALFWPEERLLVVADLHLEKGSSFARRGSLLPPYDTADTLARLGALLLRYAPRTVVALGDNFHDGGGPSRLVPDFRWALFEMARGRDWIWITGNHDPEPAAGVPGTSAEVLPVGPLTFRHEPTPAAAPGEISGHLHPVAVVSGRGGGTRRRCFVTDGARAVMPAFGAYAGGLNVRHGAFRPLFPAPSFVAHVMGEHRVYAIPSSRCLSD